MPCRGDRWQRQAAGESHIRTAIHTEAMAEMTTRTQFAVVVALFDKLRQKYSGEQVVQLEGEQVYSGHMALVIRRSTHLRSPWAEDLLPRASSGLEAVM